MYRGTGWDHLQIAFSLFFVVAEKTMVCGRYNELVNGDYFMVYKPTNITGGPHPVPSGYLT